MVSKPKIQLTKSRLSLLTAAFVFVIVGGRYLIGEVVPYRFGLQQHLPLTKSGQFDETDILGEFHGQLVQSEPYIDELDVQVLGSQDPNVAKKIEVDLTAQKLYAIENGQKIAEFNVSTGKWGRTPTGTFKIWVKLRSTKMEGGSKALNTYYYLPNVPFTMFFYNDEIPKHRGFGIHGTYWHSNYGVPMSHGCINMRTRDVERLYHWAMPDTGGKHIIHASDENPGTVVEIYGQAPES